MQHLYDGNWELTFQTQDEKTYYYRCAVLHKFVVEEKIEVDGETVLDRKADKGKIRDQGTGQNNDFEPPLDKLTLLVRRDRKAHPYLEQLFQWASSYHAFMFASSAPNEFVLGPAPPITGMLESLVAVPQLLKEALEEGGMEQDIIADMKTVGYRVERVQVAQYIQTVIPCPMVLVKEHDLDCDTIQHKMSQGMYRALSTVVILNNVLREKRPCTLAIDDIGEGLDFERSSNLIKLILDRAKNSDIQVILTSNDRHLLNAVDVRFWNILERKGAKVRAYNYSNSREAFDEFMMTGLSNFELLTGQMYKQLKRK